MTSVQHTLDLTTQRRSIRRTNLIGLVTMATLVTLDIVVMGIVYNQPLFTKDAGTLRLRITLAFMLIAWLVGARGHLRWQAFIIIFGFYSSYLLSPLIEPVGSTHPVEHYFVLLALLLIMAVIPYLLYDLKKDRKILLFWQIVIPITFIASFQYNLQNFETTSEAFFVELTQKNTMAFLGFWGVYIALLYITIQYKRSQNTYYSKLVASNKELEHNLGTIDNQNRVLAQRQEELIQLREEQFTIKDRLEELVEQRTGEIEWQHQLLLEYNFMHGHVLKAPMARIKGLLYLSTLTEDEDEKLEIRKRIKTCYAELEEAVAAISSVVESQDEDLLNTMREQAKQLYQSQVEA